MATEEVGGLESLQVLLQQNPNSLTFGRVAEALMQQGRLDEAIQLCEEGIRRHPFYVTGHMVLGKCYLQKKLFDQAEKEFKRVLLFDPQYLAAHKHYGDLMREIGWDNTCEMSYRKILHIDPLDKAVKALVEEFAGRAKGEKAPAIRPAIKPAKEAPLALPPLTAPPAFDDDYLSSTGVGEGDFLRYETPSSPDQEKISPLEFEQEYAAAAPEPPSRPLPEADEERFSYILDDIFQDEVLDEKTSKPSGPDKPAKPADYLPEDQAEAETDNFGDDEDLNETEWPQPRNDVNQTTSLRSEPPARANDGFDADADGMDEVPMQTPREPAKIQPRPVDFDLDFDEMPPAPIDSGNATPITPLPVNLDMDEPEPEDSKALTRSAPRPAASTRMPVRRGRTLADFNGDEPAPPSASEREKIVTPTLGEIYAAQGQYTKAIGVFELLSKKEPNNRNYRDKIEYLKKRLQETQNAG
ncbi:MAG: tetratricopeptide repeat protein [bacterium]